MTDAPRLVLAAGGTGGHMFPAQALAEAMLARGWQVTLSTDARGARYTGGFPDAVDIEILPSATFARGGLLAKAQVPFTVLGGIGRAAAAFRKLKPAVIVGFGGYPSIPALGAAWALGLPRMIHEQNGVLGRVNKAFAPRVDLVACGTWPTLLPKGVEGEFTGNPVRAAILEREGAPYIPPGDYPMSLLVIGGSQGARILSDTVPEALAALPEALRLRLRVSHQAREEDVARVSAAYRAASMDAEVKTFFTDVPARLADAQLVISRAGASSIADLAVIGRPSILIPYAAATADHQTANARGLVEAEAAVRIPEAALTAEALTDTVSAILTQPDAAVKMAHNALAHGRPDATERLVDITLQIANKDKTP